VLRTFSERLTVEHVIILINGPFGIGKTTVSRVLVNHLGAAIYDPERLGFVLRRILSMTDYQDHAAWRRLTVIGARLVRLRHKRLVVPMTLWRREYFAEIAGGLRRADESFYPFRLTADAEALRARILSSTEARQWRLDHLDEGVATFSDPYFGLEIRTEHKRPDEIAREICERLL
jgi:hypothetical protein